MKRGAAVKELVALIEEEDASVQTPQVAPVPPAPIKARPLIYLGEVVDRLRAVSSVDDIPHETLYRHRMFLAEALLYVPKRRAPFTFVDPLDVFVGFGEAIEALKEGYSFKPLTDPKRRKVKAPIKGLLQEDIADLLTYIPNLAVASCPEGFATEVIGLYLQFKGDDGL